MYSPKELPDIQCSIPNINIPIKQVGVENVEVPFQIQLRSGGFYQLNANVSIKTNLDDSTKGISMSRLLLTLKPYLELPLKRTLINQILTDIRNNVGSSNSYIKFDFRMPIVKKSISTINSFPIYYKCGFEGQLYQTKINVEQGDVYQIVDRFRFFQKIRIQYSSYCPCSAELCNHLEKNNYKGYPHNQRSYAYVLVEVSQNKFIWIEDIIESIENKLKTLPYPIIKRQDEMEIAKVASENPMFVEDANRIISNELNNMEGIEDWYVKCIHEESIHTSEAIAVNWKGVPGGFNSRMDI